MPLVGTFPCIYFCLPCVCSLWLPSLQNACCCTACSTAVPAWCMPHHLCSDGVMERKSLQSIAYPSIMFLFLRWFFLFGWSGSWGTTAPAYLLPAFPSALPSISHAPFLLPAPCLFLSCRFSCHLPLSCHACTHMQFPHPLHGVLPHTLHGSVCLCLAYAQILHSHALFSCLTFLFPFPSLFQAWRGQTRSSISFWIEPFSPPPSPCLFPSLYLSSATTFSLFLSLFSPFSFLTCKWKMPLMVAVALGIWWVSGGGRWSGWWEQTCPCYHCLPHFAPSLLTSPLSSQSLGRRYAISNNNIIISTIIYHLIISFLWWKWCVWCIIWYYFMHSFLFFFCLFLYLMPLPSLPFYLPYDIYSMPFLPCLILPFLFLSSSSICQWLVCLEIMPPSRSIYLFILPLSM